MGWGGDKEVGGRGGRMRMRWLGGVGVGWGSPGAARAGGDGIWSGERGGRVGLGMVKWNWASWGRAGQRRGGGRRGGHEIFLMGAEHLASKNSM